MYIYKIAIAKDIATCACMHFTLPVVQGAGSYSYGSSTCDII